MLRSLVGSEMCIRDRYGQSTGEQSLAMSSQAARKKLLEKYKPQILQLEDMGFTDRRKSFEVLVKCKGNMDTAVTELSKSTGGSKDDGLPDLLCAEGSVGDVGDLLNSDLDVFSPAPSAMPSNCLLYTSDAADEEDSVDLGGRRIIKKKKNKKIGQKQSKEEIKTKEV
eukprot:TRINITY_DN13067_c0_g1_i3.p1 TRINITY_DN13067_c0_g1~~TRINITY_DN13067_c0_g1_i3.p1  ORF type:complete len:196 (-),score=54.03 TRINITY_DN13067_c0_g1_i3:49-552(-)